MKGAFISFIDSSSSGNRTQTCWHFSSLFSFGDHSVCVFGFPDSSVGKESPCNAGDPGLIPGLGRSPGEGIDYPLQYSWASVMTQLVKNPPAMWQTCVWSLGWEDPLEKGKATHSSRKWQENLYAEYIMWNVGLDGAKLESRLLGEMSVTSDTQMTPPLWQKVKKN